MESLTTILRADKEILYSPLPTSGILIFRRWLKEFIWDQGIKPDRCLVQLALRLSRMGVLAAQSLTVCFVLAELSMIRTVGEKLTTRERKQETMKLDGEQGQVEESH